VLQFLDDGAGNVVDVNSVSKTTNVSSLTGGTAALPFFTDGTKIYTGAITSLASEDVGLAQRITVNADLVGDPSKLVTYAAGVASGDSTRPNFILNQLTNATTTFSANTGIGMTSSPFSGTIGTFVRQIISQQGENADAAANLKQGQDVVLSSLQQRFNEASSVNVDEEMTNLLQLQNSYSANARVLSAVRDMLNTLLAMGVQ
jgi:flagellar hook-associated protein 1 FlgK